MDKTYKFTINSGKQIEIDLEDFDTHYAINLEYEDITVKKDCTINNVIIESNCVLENNLSVRTTSDNGQVNFVHTFYKYGGSRKLTALGIVDLRDPRKSVFMEGDHKALFELLQELRSAIKNWKTKEDQEEVIDGEVVEVEEGYLVLCPELEGIAGFEQPYLPYEGEFDVIDVEVSLKSYSTERTIIINSSVESVSDDSISLWASNHISKYSLNSYYISALTVNIKYHNRSSDDTFWKLEVASIAKTTVVQNAALAMITSALNSIQEWISNTTSKYSNKETTKPIPPVTPAKPPVLFIVAKAGG